MKYIGLNLSKLLKIEMNSNMRKFIYISFTATLLLTSCVSIKEIGHVNVLSSRNVVLDGTANYARVATYAGESASELKKSKSITIDEAVNNTVRNYPGGEFMSNVKIWQITKGKKIYFAVSGDIFGLANEHGEVERSHRGFSVGDAVLWEESNGKFRRGTIETLVDNETCIVHREDGKLVKVKYTKLSK